MAKKKTITEENQECASSTVRDEKLSADKQYNYLEHIRDFIYKDVVLADTKAGFALTIVTVSLAAAAVLLKDIFKVQFVWSDSLNFCLILGLICAGISIFCSMLTILPRSYLTHEIVKNPNHWVHLEPNTHNDLIKRFLDVVNVIYENLWQKQSKGGTNSITLLIKSGTDKEMVDSLKESMQRSLLTQYFKFLWVGKALLFAFLAFCLIATSLLLSIRNSDKNYPLTSAAILNESNTSEIFTDSVLQKNTLLSPISKIIHSQQDEINVQLKSEEPKSYNLKLYPFYQFLKNCETKIVSESTPCENWLENAGFSPNDNVNVIVMDKLLIIHSTKTIEDEKSKK